MYSKYHAKKTIIDGITFDSKKEAKRYTELKRKEKAGEIESLELQKKYVLIPPQKDENGKCRERECSYYADFVYSMPTGETIVEDTKGMKTPEYIIKRKLMLYFYGIKIAEV